MAPYQDIHGLSSVPVGQFEFSVLGRTYRAATRPVLLAFANKVREAGGGTPLAALMPAVPANPQQCLIARSLNFSCAVRPESIAHHLCETFPSGAVRWVMDIDSEAKAFEIAKKAGLDLRYNKKSKRFVLLLPEEIGNAALAFDYRVEEFSGLTEAY